MPRLAALPQATKRSTCKTGASFLSCVDKKDVTSLRCNKAVELIPFLFAFHSLGNVLFPGQSKAPAQQAEQLPPAAIAVAVPLCTPDNGDDQRDAKEQHTQPGKQNVEKTSAI